MGFCRCVSHGLRLNLSLLCSDHVLGSSQILSHKMPSTTSADISGIYFRVIESRTLIHERVLFSGLYYRTHMHNNNGHGMYGVWSMSEGLRYAFLTPMACSGWHDRQQGRTIEETGGEGDREEGRWRDRKRAKMMRGQNKKGTGPGAARWAAACLLLFISYLFLWRPGPSMSCAYVIRQTRLSGP